MASSPLTILSVAILSNCTPVATVTFLWTVKNGDVITSINSSSLDRSIFAIAPYVLAVNNFYTITVTASTATAPASIASASITVSVTHGFVIAVIAGGTYRSAPVDKALQLDASGSYDSDFPPTLAPSLTYQVQ